MKEFGHALLGLQYLRKQLATMYLRRKVTLSRMCECVVTTLTNSDIVIQIHVHDPTYTLVYLHTVRIHLCIIQAPTPKPKHTLLHLPNTQPKHTHVYQYLTYIHIHVRVHYAL